MRTLDGLGKGDGLVIGMVGSRLKVLGLIPTTSRLREPSVLKLSGADAIRKIIIKGKMPQLSCLG